MHTHDSNLRPSVREHFTDNHATTLRDTTVSTPNRPAPANAWEAVTAFLARIDWRNAYPHTTNALALGFVGFYAYDFSTIAANGNHIYTIYRLFPVVAALAITLSMWRLPDNSLTRLFYLVGLYVIAWLGG
jgi:hypothetical protein